MKNDNKHEFDITSEVFGQKIKQIHTCGGAPEQFEEFSYFALHRQHVILSRHLFSELEQSITFRIRYEAWYMTHKMSEIGDSQNFSF